MKKILLLLALLISIETVNAQVSTEVPSFGLYQDGEFSIGVSAMYIEYQNFAVRTGYGLTLKTAVHKNVSLSWHLHFGRRYFSTSMWLPLGPLLFSASVLNGNINRNALALLLTSLIPDGVAFPMRISDKVFITPSISPFWLEMYGKDEAYKRFYIGGNVGLGVHLKLKHFNIHPHGAVHLLYKSKPNLGFSGALGIEFPLRNLRK